MSKMWFVMVLLIAQNVYAIDKIEDMHKSCDKCITSGPGHKWCNLKTNEGHCYTNSRDDACLAIEHIPYNYNEVPGKLLDPKSLELTLTANMNTPTDLKYLSSEQRKITISFLNEDHKDLIEVREGKTKCDDKQCTVVIKATASSEFCSRNVTAVDVIIEVENISEKAQFKYSVPCSCPCSKNTIHKSPRCNKHGTFVCGVCICEDEWHGDNCEDSCSPRGDIEDVCADENGKECSGNGVCVCNACQCFEDKEGSQYFDEKEKCSDICTQTAEFHDCLKNDSVECISNSQKKHLTVLPLNETAINLKNEANRTVWILCQHQEEEECSFQYYASKTEARYLAMIKIKCAGVVAGIAAASGGANWFIVPLVTGLIVCAAAVIALGAFWYWNHMNALPPHSASNYENIVPDDCQGISPIYKSPTTKFVNPTYGN